MATTAYQDIGSDAGPLQHIWIGVDGAFNARHVGNAGFQFSPENSELGDAGTFLAYSSIYSPNFGGHRYSNLGLGIPGMQDWDQHSQSAVVSANGMSRVVTMLQTLGDDLTLYIVDTYVHGQDCWRTDYILQNNYTAELEVILYRAANVFLNGTEDGYGVLRADGSVGVAANADNNPPGNVLWFVPLVADEYFEGDPADLWDILENLSALTNTIVATDGDAAMGLAWGITIPAGALAVRSCLTQVQIAAPIVPPTVDAWHFRGFCYRGADGDTATPLGGVTLKLYVGSTSTFGSATLKRTTVSDAAGFWNFYEDQEYTYYWVQAVVPSGMSATGVSTDDGTIISTTLLRWGASPARGVHAGNRFFMV